MINVARNEGVLALYTGLSASLLRQGTYSTVRFGTYDLLKDKFGPKDGSKFHVSLLLFFFFLSRIGVGGIKDTILCVNDHDDYRVKALTEPYLFFMS